MWRSQEKKVKCWTRSLLVKNRVDVDSSEQLFQSRPIHCHESGWENLSEFIVCLRKFIFKLEDDRKNTKPTRDLLINPVLQTTFMQRKWCSNSWVLFQEKSQLQEREWERFYSKSPSGKVGEMAGERISRNCTWRESDICEWAIGRRTGSGCVDYIHDPIGSRVPADGAGHWWPSIHTNREQRKGERENNREAEGLKSLENIP